MEFFGFLLFFLRGEGNEREVKETVQRIKKIRIVNSCTKRSDGQISIYKLL